ncbi:prolyl oligopeptidase family serine peptidase [Spongiactinospora sp. 9N601]|uniref:S9 family peptidase n=1 Tax=Spongiactinospora sp. 9N601 TaxID=3375149 RepID=UPI0037ABBF28
MSRPLAIDDLYRFALPDDPDLSPDGERVVYTLTTQDAENDRPVSCLWEVRADGGPPRRLTRGPADSSPRWSPDGTSVAFLREGRLHLLPAAGGEAVPVGGDDHPHGAPVWSPDGTRIAFSALVPRKDANAPVVVDRLWYKADGAGLLGQGGVHIFVIDVATGDTRRLTGGDIRAGVPAWSPDGTRLAFAAAVADDRDLTGAYPVHVIDVAAEGAEPRAAGFTSGMAGEVLWYPDGTALLVSGRTTVTSGHEELFRQPLDGPAPVPLTASLDRNVMTGGPGYPGARPAFVGDDILFCARDRGVTRLYRADAGGVTELPLPAGTGIGGCSVAAKAGRAALITADGATFGEVALLDLGTGEVAALTGHTADALPDVTFYPVTEREFTISDGTRVHGFVIRDPQAPRGGPLLVDVHGGPHNAWAPHADPAHLYHQELARRGWTILALNIRGSDGYGEDFFTAAVGAWGEADERDILEPVRELIGEGLVHPRGIALTGYSYGGFMSCWLSARSDVFAAVVPGGVVTDLRSDAGTADIGPPLTEIEIGGLDRQAELSPLTYVDGVRAPTLILHGDADERCPAGQAEEWFHALRVRGVPVRLVRYPGASHLFILTGRPSHRADYCRRVVDWVTEHTVLDGRGADHD